MEMEGGGGGGKWLPYDKLRYNGSAPATPSTGGGGGDFDFRQPKRQPPPPLLCRTRCFVTILCCILAVGAMLSLGIALALRAASAHHSQPPATAAASDAIRAACNATLYPDLCYQWLSNSSSADDPLSLAAAAVRLALSLVQNATAQLSASKSNTTLSAAARDCLELMNLAGDQLNASLLALRSLPLLHLKPSLFHILVQLSGSLSFNLACSLSLQEASSSDAQLLLLSQENVSRSVIIALGIVNAISRLGIDLSSWTTHSRRRRLLLSFHLDPWDDPPLQLPDAFPSWISEPDRRMLQSSSSFSPDVVVASDASGNFKSIGEALANVPAKRSTRYTIYIKTGVYPENLVIPKSMKNLTLVGDGMGMTVITGSRSNVGGSTTYDSATVAVSGPGFIARSLTFRNSAGASGHQAVAVRCNADYAVFDKCGFEGYQDTLYALANRQFYSHCTISGTVDFIFGNAIAVFQGCQILARRPLDTQKNTVTAHGRKTPDDPSGFSFHLCTVEADKDLQMTSSSIPTYYGRPWHAYARTVWMQSTISNVIDPAGWLPWDPTNAAAATVYYGEYQNSGDGAGTSSRVSWPGVHPAMTPQEASGFTVQQFIAGASWLPATDVSFQASLS